MPEGDQPEGRRLLWIGLIVLLAVVAFVAAIAVQRNVFPFYSGDHDEPVYRFQAEMLRDGHITIPRAQDEFFRPWLSGPSDDHLVMAFTPAWPAVLMVADALTGSMLVALGAAAALIVVTAYAFAHQLLPTRGQAVLATALLTLSPFTLMLTGTYLNYAFAVGLYLLFGALLLRALRTDSPRLLVLAGLTLGLAFLTRPFDALLFALPFAVLIVATRRSTRGAVARIGGWVGLGLVPGVVTMLVYNAALTSSPLTFPTTKQSEGWSTFGWGIRSIAPDTPKLDFTVGEAFASMGWNLWALPTWLFGTYLVLALAAFGAFRLWRTDRERCLLLLGLAAVFPIGYLTWWASSLTVNGAMSGLGPHYYLPVLVPVTILAAHGIAEAARHRRGLVIGGVVVAVVLTAIALPPKIDEKQDLATASRRYNRDVEAGLRRRDGAPAVVTQERRNRATYIMEPYPFLSNPPDLEAPVLYARDRGPRNVELLDRMPERRAYRLVRELQPGRDIRNLPVVVKPQSVVRGPEVAFRTRIVNRSGEPAVTAYLRRGRRVSRRVLDTRSREGETYDVTWIVSPDGIEYSGPPATARRARVKRMPGGIAVGATFGHTPQSKHPDAAERRFYVRTREGRGHRATEALTADEQWTYFGRPLRAWLPIAVDGTLDVELAPTAG
jgi:hypothetical protein